ncbi:MULTISPECIES: universal stress protein [Nocardioides]|uniref:Universal stress protein n=1 Tax=Nocardioides vastitatis TaxID=2568655 RepID=A0ABW0ZIL2_9ACTN|nr:universal stress protein [Nocardioides sp.]
MSDHISPSSIIVGVDGSDDSDRALQWAAEQAHLERRPLVVVTAVAAGATTAANVRGITLSGVGAVYAYADDDLLAFGKEVAMDAVDTARRLRPGLEVGAHVTLGDAREVLVDLSARVYLIVLGSRGRGTVRSKILGSVSATVSRQAACPVVVCRPDGLGTHDAGVLVGADGTAESGPVVEFAFRQASLRGAPVTVLHCMWDSVAAVHGPALAPATEPGLEEQRMLLSETIAGLAEKFPEVRVELQLAHGFAAECLSAGSPRWGLIVVGRHPVDSIPRLVAGSIATSVMEQVRTTVAVVPEAKPA